jgi:signal transduction histidine kinase
MLEAVFERSRIGIAVLGDQEEILFANAAFARLVGYSPAELAGTSLTHLKTTGSGVPGLKNKTGGIVPARLVLSRVDDSEGGVTALAMLEESGPGTTEAARLRATRMDALVQLTGGIAHDFNNMLTVILANSELLASALASDPPALADLEELRAAARRGTTMVRKLLGFSRRERLVLQPLDLGALTGELSRHIGQLLPGNVYLDVGAEPTSNVLVDPNAIEQILLNLLSNSADAMPQGGRITVRTESCRLDAEHLRKLGWGEPGDYVSLTVTDTGVGMDERTRDRLFEPFFTTKPPGLGTGLGLAMVYGLVKQHNGYILIDSEPNAGSTVRIYFPVAQAGDAALSILRETLPRGGNETILLVEDEEPIRRTARKVLERFGYRVQVAADGEEALEVIRERGEEIDLVISDVVMPRMGGRGLYDAARASGAKMKFLFASGYTARDVGATGEIDADMPFIHKPWTIADFVRRVREVLDR